MARLDERVFDEGQAGFRDVFDAVIALRFDFDAKAGKDGGKLGDFFAVVTGEEDGLHGAQG